MSTYQFHQFKRPSASSFSSGESWKSNILSWSCWEPVKVLDLSMLMKMTAQSKAHLCSYISKQWWLESWHALLDLAAFTFFSTKLSEVKMCCRPVQWNLASNSKWRKMHIHRDKELASEEAPPKVLQDHTLICVYQQWLLIPVDTYFTTRKLAMQNQQNQWNMHKN